MSKINKLKSSSWSLLIGSFVVLGVGKAWSMQDQGHDKHSHGAVEAAQKQEFAGDPYLLDIDAVSGRRLGAIGDQVVLQHEGRELRFSGEQTAATFRADPAKYLPAVDEKMVAQQLPFYALDTCVVSEEEFGGDMGEPIDLIHKNRLVRLCCKGCTKGFAKDPAAHIAKIDKAIIERQGTPYPLTTCVVSGEELGSMGDPIDLIMGNRLVRLCCKGCLKKAKRDPLAYLAKLDSKAGVEHGHDGHDHAGHGDHEHGDK